MDSSGASSQDGNLDDKIDEEKLESRPASPPAPLSSMENLGSGSKQELQHPPFREQDEDKDTFLVKFDKDDPANPRNWSTSYKAFITGQLGLLAFAGSLASSIISPATGAIAREFGVSTEIVVLTVSLYVIGFVIGPCMWAPISETYGRKIGLLPPLVVLGLFSIGTASCHTFAGILVTRFFAGVFGAAPVSNVSAALGDLYEPKVRGTPVTFYAIAVVGGPILGPIIGSSLTVTLGWRWTEWIQAITTFFAFAVALITMPELYPSVLLARKARRLRKETGDERYFHPHEKEKVRLDNIVTKYLSRPVMMLVTEPMVTAIAIYASFVFGILYMSLEMLPIEYQEKRHWSLVVSTLPFLGMFIGILASVGLNLGNQPRYARAVEKNRGRAVPEARLPPMFIGGWLFVIGIFWFGWTCNPKIHWAVPTVATAFIGAGFNIIFQQCINFLVDTYGLYAASAVSANTILRSFIACGLPLAAKPLFHNLGLGPGSSILGGVAALALPVPLIFMKYGPTLRKMSKFAPVDED